MRGGSSFVLRRMLPPHSRSVERRDRGWTIAYAPFHGLTVVDRRPDVSFGGRARCLGRPTRAADRRRGRCAHLTTGHAAAAPPSAPGEVLPSSGWESWRHRPDSNRGIKVL